jgi:hypothetical protein
VAFKLDGAGEDLLTTNTLTDQSALMVSTDRGGRRRRDRAVGDGACVDFDDAPVRGKEPAEGF